jgi:RNA polymerase sigma-70 factor (ECF subfamily)
MVELTLKRWNEPEVTDDDLESRQIAAAQRDIRAFAPLYEAYFDSIYGYALRSLRDRDLAADVTSDTFARAMNALPRFRGKSFRSWLFTIAHNVIVDSVRRRKPTASFDEMLSIPDRGTSPEEALLANETARHIATLLDRLTENQRQVVVLRTAGLTGQEVADVLGMSVGAVKAAQFRAYNRLRQWLTEEPDHVDGETS